MSLKEVGQKLADLIEKPSFVPWFMLALSILSYGLLIPWLHFYIDDLIWAWTWETMGPAGLTKYFATNRPVWGLLYQVSLPFLTQSILVSHLFSLLVRWGSGLACWWLVQLIWPDRPRIALTAGLIFLLYPGFALQPIALTYGHLFLVYTAFLLSLALNILAIRRPKRFWVYTAAAAVLSLLNLLMLEFFFTLELVRLIFLWVISGECVHQSERAQRLLLTRSKHALMFALPYLFVLAGAVIWRTVIFKFQQHRYQLSLFDHLKAQPLLTVLQLLQKMATDLWETSLGAWEPAVRLLVGVNWRQFHGLATLAVIAVVLLFVLTLLYRGQKIPAQPKRSSLEVIMVGLAAMLLAGWPFWLTELDVQPVEFQSRFTLPFILGAALLLSGLIELLRVRWMRVGLLAIFLAAASGYHFQIANRFRLDWQTNQQLFRQIAWRIPSLTEGTTLFLTDFPVSYYNLAALSTELNWIYPAEERSPDLSSFIFYAREFDHQRPGALQASQPIGADNISAVFRGNTSQVLMAQFDLGRCFRLLDPELDGQDMTLSDPVRKAAQASDLRWVKVDAPSRVPPIHWFGDEPPANWCTYFEKAELARQRGDWETAARLGDEAQAAGFEPRDVMEKLVFIEAYAHTSQWQKAIEMSLNFDNREKQPMLCLLWQRIQDTAQSGEEKERAIQFIAEKGICP